MFKGYHFTAKAFLAHYNSKGWMIGKNKMKCWKSACVTWESRWEEKNPNHPKQQTPEQVEANAAHQKKMAKELFGIA